MEHSGVCASDCFRGSMAIADNREVTVEKLCAKVYRGCTIVPLKRSPVQDRAAKT